MRIRIITPAPPRSRSGNRVTALRWQRILRQLGYQVSVEEEYHGGDCDILIALHARKSFDSVERYRRKFPNGHLIVTLTGTDVYRDLTSASEPLDALRWADKVIILQPLAEHELPIELWPRVVTIYQSAPPIAVIPPDPRHFDVCIVGHLREVKDPLRAAEAARLLPESSRVRVFLAGAAIEPEYEVMAKKEASINPRFHRLGEVPRWKARRLIARSRLLVLSSIMEGGANVISEALAASTPVLSTRIPGSVGLLGEDYPGYFGVGATEELAELIWRAESDSAFYGDLKRRCEERKWLTDPALELESWKTLLNSFKTEGGL